jgi:hypothetical protein
MGRMGDFKDNFTVTIGGQDTYYLWFVDAQKGLIQGKRSDRFKMKEGGRVAVEGRLIGRYTVWFEFFHASHLLPKLKVPCGLR